MITIYVWTFLTLFTFNQTWICEGRELLQYLNRRETPARVTYSGTIVVFMNHNYDPHNAIDGLKGSPDECNCCAGFNRPATLTIDLKTPYHFSHIVLHARSETGFEDHFRNLNLAVKSTASTEQSYPISATNKTFILSASKALQDVQSIVISSTGVGFMVICEVEIFQPDVNITSQSSTYSTCFAHNAINAETFTNAGFNDQLLCQACSATTFETDPWWELDLGSLKLLKQIKVFGRTDILSSQSTNIELRISNTSLGESRNGTPENILTISMQQIVLFDGPRLARIINIKHARTTVDTILTVCQVDVYAGDCLKGTYGDACSRSCHCKDTCDYATGDCSACLPGWTSASCDKACVGSYGENCSYLCTGNCRNNETCNIENGHCLHGCKPGYDFSKDPLCNTVCRHINIPHCVSGQQQCDGFSDGIMCTQCEPGYHSGGYNQGCIDYNCTFESDSTCAWTDVTSGDDFDWTLTYGKYMYIGTSGSRKTGERAWLISPMLRSTSFTEKCLQFGYSMNGLSIGIISVYMTANGEKPGSLLWRMSGDQGQEWKGASVNLSSLEQYQVIIEAVVGNSYFGDIAIDDVAILPTACQQEKGLLIG
ncbi:uncharacterized protein LOC127836837 isoform X2 [Dreissena polymorpha]|uniref:uncharacterized protein LOC127836837 isoform X2 n=1 Tax=Dreissena polymorpha TaxID=45954 RepID=UPI002264A584|nr:uncharacterized protein LOC127836837 isoform X2 [Dreissena polymorpha]